MPTHRGTQTIETPRLMLRRATVADAQAMFDNWASDPQVTRYLMWPAHTSTDLTRQVLQSWVNGYQQDLANPGGTRASPPRRWKG